MEEDWPLDLFDNIEREILDDKFVLSNISYTHYYFFDPDTIEGSILSTSIRVYPFNGTWIKRIVTRYKNSNNEEKEISYERAVDESLIVNIENNTDLRKLNNSYTSGDDPREIFEIIYNNIYKIVGDKTVSVKDIDYVRTILEVNDILRDEKKKVSGLL